jgi:predicted dehydrogenase
MSKNVTRREFVKSSAALAAAPLAVAAGAHAAGSDEIRVGLIGCGGRGTGAAHNELTASPQVRIAALGDVFADRLESCRVRLEGVGERGTVDKKHCHVGFDAYQEVIAGDVHAVILATPPHFRPMHFAAAVDAGRHVFMEKPVAVDPVGIRTILAAAEKADRHGLSVVAGTQRRHEPCYLAAMKEVHGGRIGRIVSAQCYWNMGGLWMNKPRAEWSDMEWQLRNWLYFTWLSGDHIVEQHVHNLDVVNWAVGDFPARAMGMGGRQVRTDPDYGHIFDHFAIEYEYPDGVHLMSMCRQIDGCANRVEEVIQGTEGRAVLRPGYAVIEGSAPWRFDAENQNPYVEEQRDLVHSITGEGTHYNEARTVALSTLTAIMGRMSAYTGKQVTWEQIEASALDLSPSAYAFTDLPVSPVAMPGTTPLI